MTKNNSAAPSGLADFLHARGVPSLFSSRFQVLLPSPATLVGLSSSSALVEVFHPKKSCYDRTPCFVSGTCLYTASIVQSESFQCGIPSYCRRSDLYKYGLSRLASVPKMLTSSFVTKSTFAPHGPTSASRIQHVNPTAWKQKPPLVPLFDRMV